MDEKDDLGRALNTWKVPEPSAALDYRLLASYRGAMLAVPWWRRVLRARISVPVPVAAALAVCVLTAFTWVARSGSTPGRPPIAVQPASGSPCGEVPAAPPETRSLIAGSAEGTTFVTVGDFSGFRPVKDWNITIETKGGKR